MILNFQPRFVSRILKGSKTHTIRGYRKDGKIPRVGETCHCYTGLRRKGARLLGRWECVKVETITIASNTPYDTYGIWINGNILAADERIALAVRDGFPKGFDEMMEFWKGRLPFEGHVIHWRFTPQRRERK